MSTLHQLMSDDHRAMKDCLAMVRPGDEILFLDSGVNLLSGHFGTLMGNSDDAIRLFASASDVRKLDLESRVNEMGVSQLDDDAWVEKVCHHDQVLSWI
jgi:sulfur relay protein TusB/DsrH